MALELTHRARRLAAEHAIRRQPERTLEVAHAGTARMGAMPAALVLLAAAATPVRALRMQRLARVLHAKRRPRRGPDNAVGLQPVRALEGPHCARRVAAEHAIGRQLESPLQPAHACRLDLRSACGRSGGPLLRSRTLRL